jgi:methylamine utilization protein MauE
VSTVFTGPLLAAAGLLCVSGLAKLRTPEPASTALRTLGLRVGSSVVRAAAAVESAVGFAAVLVGGRAWALALAVAYGGFAGLTVRLSRQRAACGCFGAGEAPAGRTQLALSLGLMALAGAAAIWPPGGIGWVLARSAAYAMTLLAGVGGCIYALAIAYTQLPSAWAAWSGR